jgi:hypothetical protein
MFAGRLIGVDGMLKVMQLSWLDLTLLTGEKFGGWVAVHFIAFSRLLKWVYSAADFVSPDEIYEEPDSRPSSQWLVRELAGWLKCRGLDSTGKKQELLDRVLGLYDKEEFRVPSGQRGGTVELLTSTIAKLQEMIQWVMKRDIASTEHYTELERRIRVFLTCFARLEEGVRQATDRLEKKPGWLTAYNFLTLLNLPEQIKTFGSPRWHWEGTVAGEGFLRFVKRYMRRGLQNGWQKNLLTHLLRDKAFTNIFQNTKEDTGAWWRVDDKNASNAKLAYYCYKSADVLLERLLSGYPISIQIRSADQVSCVFVDPTQTEPVLLDLSFDSFHSDVNGLAYWDWTIDTESATSFNKEERNWVCGIMLPLLTGTGAFPARTGAMRYGVIDEEWRELKADGKFRN